MGLDAMAVRSSAAPEVFEAAFKEAHDRALQQAGGVDGLLEEGGLDTSTCLHALTEVASVFGLIVDRRPDWGVEWDAAYVAALDRDREAWRQVAADERGTEPWAFRSAREFIRACALTGAGVAFN